MPTQPEVFTRDLERVSDEAESALLRAMIVYAAVNDQEEDEEDDEGLLAFFLRSAIAGFIATVINLTERHSDGPLVLESERDRITVQALAAAHQMLRVAVRADPQMLSGDGDVSRAERLRNVAGSAITATRSRIQQELADHFGFVSKTWMTRRDLKVRAAHRRLHGVTVPIDQRFETTGGSLRYPGDPTAPLNLIINCRCGLRWST